MAGSVTIPKRKKSSWSTPLLFLSFGLVFVVLFNRDLQIALGEWVGYALNPLIGFGGAYPVLTIFFASVILVVLTTAIRHFLVDWTMMARTTEAVRTFQKEFMAAKKENNTYKIKKLTDAQPEVFALQADMQKDQMKPMAFTMLLVIPLFAWLGTTLSHPVDFTVTDAPEEPTALLFINDQRLREPLLLNGSSNGIVAFSGSTDTWGHALRLPTNAGATGAIGLRNTEDGSTYQIPIDGAPVVNESAKAFDLAPGTHSLRLEKRGENTTLRLTGDAPIEVDRALGIVVAGGATQKLVKITEDPVELTLDGAATLYVVIPHESKGAQAEGASRIFLTGAETKEAPLGNASLIELDRARLVEVVPFSAEVPWKAPWDLQEPDGWLGWLPHWILLYSLFGIPFGQVAQRALKLWEYRKVDLDGDGVPAGGR